jgi:hypothetical protein
MKRFFKIVGIVLGLLIAGTLVAGVVVNEKRPDINPSERADSLAREMMAAVNVEAWDTTRYVQWSFAGLHDFLWDKERNLVEVTWGNKTVLLHTKTVTGQAFEKGIEVSGKKKEKMVQRAWSFFCNDSFWLNAVVKAFDPGTERTIVPLKEGGEGLMVSYSSGGVTPGDSYLWILDENNRPVAWKMWVKIIPIGGVRSSWADWVQLPTGAWVATSHKTAFLTSKITNLEAGMSLTDLGMDKDPFAEFPK